MYAQYLVCPQMGEDQQAKSFSIMPQSIIFLIRKESLLVKRDDHESSIIQTKKRFSPNTTHIMQAINSLSIRFLGQPKEIHRTSQLMVKKINDCTLLKYRFHIILDQQIRMSITVQLTPADEFRIVSVTHYSLYFRFLLSPPPQYFLG